MEIGVTKKRCEPCECYDCDCEESSCDCHHNDRVSSNSNDRDSGDKPNTEVSEYRQMPVFC